jgi:hypothetical protein
MNIALQRSARPGLETEAGRGVCGQDDLVRRSGRSKTRPLVRVCSALLALVRLCSPFRGTGKISRVQPGAPGRRSGSRWLALVRICTPSPEATVIATLLFGCGFGNRLSSAMRKRRGASLPAAFQDGSDGTELCLLLALDRVGSHWLALRFHRREDAMADKGETFASVFTTRLAKKVGCVGFCVGCVGFFRPFIGMGDGAECWASNVCFKDVTFWCRNAKKGVGGLLASASVRFRPLASAWRWGVFFIARCGCLSASLRRRLRKLGCLGLQLWVEWVT